jgi:hypothetical protein
MSSIQHRIYLKRAGLLESFVNEDVLNESIRQGLPHITTMDHDQFHNLTHDGKVHVNDVTEKTDGQAMVMGHDHEGFYTQSTGSGNEKMRHPEDYEKRAKARAEVTGKPYDPTTSKAFGHIHKTLQANEKLQKHLHDEHKRTGEDVKVRGESFYKPWGKPSEHPGEVKFVGTSYATHHMGKVGKFVIHSKLPENQHHDLEHFKKHLSDSNINFDDDKIEHKKGHVDVSPERKEFNGLDHDLIKARTTKSNKEAKEEETAKFNHIKKKVADKVDSHIKSLGIEPKWGSGTEGAVIHPSSASPHSPRFKVTSDAFRAYRASDASKNLKKRD